MSNLVGFSQKRGVSLLFLVVSMATIQGQTEGDTGYDYPDYPDETYDENVVSMGPVFDVEVSNVTVLEGQTAVLPCKIQYLSMHSVVWIDRLTIPLTHGEFRIIDDHRFSVVRMDVNDWNLQITYVKGSDAGTYLCSVNSQPIKEKKVHLFVKVPPKIIREHSTNDLTIREGEGMVLNCTATGSPKPLITWYRKVEDELPGCVMFSADAGLAYNQSLVPGAAWSYEGEQLVLQNISRKCRGRIRCLASNDIPDTDEEDFMISVQFPPEISLPTRRLGQLLGSRETILNCVIRAAPLAINYWEKNSKRLEKSPKYRVDAYPEDEFTITLGLSISDLGTDDYGDYRCAASNYLGSVQDVVHLFQVKPSRSLNRMLAKNKGEPRGIEGFEGVDWEREATFQPVRHYGGSSHRDRHPPGGRSATLTGGSIFISFSYQILLAMIR